MRDLPETMEPVFADGKEIAPKGFEFVTKESVGDGWSGKFYMRDITKDHDKWDLYQDHTIGFHSDLVYIRPIPEKAAEAKALFLQIVPQTHEEKMAMYMKLSKKELAEMLINCNVLLEVKSGFGKPTSLMIHIN